MSVGGNMNVYYRMLILHHIICVRSLIKYLHEHAEYVTAQRRRAKKILTFSQIFLEGNQTSYFQ